MGDRCCQEPCYSIFVFDLIQFFKSTNVPNFENNTLLVVENQILTPDIHNHFTRLLSRCFNFCLNALTEQVFFLHQAVK